MAQVESAGFKLIAEPELPELEENYIMIFEASAPPRPPRQSVPTRVSCGA